jgi:plastocyanin
MRRAVTLSIALVPFVLVLGWAAAGVVLAGGGCHEGIGATPTEGNATVVKIDGCTFAPTVTRVPLGTQVQFLNSSPQFHDVTGRNGEWGSGTLQDGQSFALRFGVTGLYPYSCSLHPGMAGVVIVGSPIAAAAQPAVAATAETEPVSATAPAAPAAPTSADTSPIPYAAGGDLGLLAGVGLGAAITRRRRPA